ncbi:MULTISPECIES: LacI family DNA-binding transcriptional regulator [Paenarthrobacter]|uniref:LacI family DNA-binding transcriptional regulator n=1 Tax=Paenarthrobacter TaxID=1742992 RepID=UPI001BB67B96|nr:MULTISPECIES: LacI family DNA-binding transcriptional regulator [Paenarthrobacter]QSZ51853.1 LacI family transcriptional regulator [Paenarthrobacter ureafaciens]WOC61430.1 LacI family DNA-binding transcriptional regulator [Paenarthrobacter sp. AT5]BCW82633.1 LacI family transcriptional regulator [Arthrobacter sp. NicSoilE8]
MTELSPPAAELKTLGGDAETRPQKANATIYDIAKLAGVNPSTVSRALSKPGRVSVHTRKLVEEAAAELNYQANPFAKALPTGRTSTIGLIVTDIANPTFFGTIRGTEFTAADHDYSVILAESAESARKERSAAQRMLASVDGLILASPRMDDDHIRQLSEEKPVIVVNRDVQGITCVVPDVEKGLGEAVRHLALNGHQKVTFIAGPEASWMSGRRWLGVKQACEWSRIEAVKLNSASPTIKGGRAAARTIVGSGTTAVIAYNDLLAIGLLHELQAAAYVVPDQVSIIGFDDIFGADFTTPALTTVRAPMEACGVEAASLLLRALKGTEKGPSTHYIDTELVVRGSTGKLTT